jgi:hypothetical protein
VSNGNRWPCFDVYFTGKDCLLEEKKAMGLRRSMVLLFVFTTVVAAPRLLLAGDGNNDRVHFFQNINIGPDEQVGDVVCIGCSIHMSGTSGDTVAILGSIEVDGTVKGDVVAVAGGIKLGEDATVSGDTVGLGWGITRHPSSKVDGEIVSQSGPLLFIGLIVIPFLPLILLIWLIVWLLRRDRPAAPVAAYRR